MRRYRIQDKKSQSERHESLLGLTQLIELGDAEMDEVADLEPGETTTIDSRYRITRTA